MAPLHASLNLWTWQWDPTVLLGTLALWGGYAWLIRRRGRVAAWSPLARVSFAGGLLALFLALESPIDVGGDKYLFSLHMLQHLLLAMIVPPLLLLGLPEEWRAFTRIRVSPLAASLVFNLVLAVWHLPFLYEATLCNEPVHVLEHLTFLAAVVIYPFYAAAPRVMPLSPLEDQLVAGLVMFGLGNLIYFAAIWAIFFRLDDKGATAGDQPVVEVERPATMRR